MEEEKYRHIYFECNYEERQTINNFRTELYVKGITFDTGLQLQHRVKSRWWLVNYVRWFRQQIRHRKKGPFRFTGQNRYVVEWHTDWSLSGATVDDIITELNEREIPHKIINV